MLAVIQEQVDLKHLTLNTQTYDENSVVELMIDSFLSPPEGEEEILQEIQELVGTLGEGVQQQTGECLTSDPESHYSAVPSLPVDGDFLELSDLFPSFLDSSINSNIYELSQDTWEETPGFNSVVFNNDNGFQQTSSSGGGYDRAKSEVFYGNT